MPPALRLYQIAAIDALRASLRDGHRAPICVAPTGAGKTTIAAWMIESAVARGKRVLFLAHRKELIDQAHRRLAEYGVPSGGGMGDDPRTDHRMPVQVASVPTLIRRPPLSPAPDIIVTDECHRAPGASNSKVLAMYPAAVVIGLTATPFRLDGRGLGEVFDDIVVVTNPDTLVAEGFLVAPRVFSPWRPDLKGVATVAGDWNQEQLGARCREGCGDVLDAWKRHAGPGTSTLAFAVTIEHSMALLDTFTGAGVSVAHVDGTTPKGERDAGLGPHGTLARGEVDVVCNVGVLTEGFDCPAVSCVVLARPTQSRALYLQMVGRGLRPFAGKDSALLLDFGANVARHGWPTDDLSAWYTLEGRMPKSKEDAASVKTCKGCYAIFPSTVPWPCPACGWMPEEKPEYKADERKGVELAETQRLKATSVEGMKRARKDFEFWEGQRLQRGYAKGWVAHRFKGKYGYWPPSWWTLTAGRVG